MIGIVVQAHMTSTRLPGKVMKVLAGKPLLWHVVERCKRSRNAGMVIVATSEEPADDVIADFCEAYGYEYVRGSDKDVLARVYKAVEKFDLDAVMRVTSDCPLIDSEIIDRVIDVFKGGDYDYAADYLNYDYLDSQTPHIPSFPHGLEVEMFARSALERAYRESHDPWQREHMTYVWQNQDGSFKLAPAVSAPPEYRRNHRLTVDYPEDFALMEKIYDTFYREGEIISVLRVLDYLDEHPEVAEINATRAQK